MMKPLTLEGPSMRPASGGQPRALVVLLHGWGADGQDLIGLAPYFAQALPDAAFVSPNGPFPCDTGFGRQWFSLSDRSPEALLAGVRAAQGLVDGFLDDMLDALNLTPDRLALVGFSQGTMTSLFVAARRPEPVAAVVGYSGMLIAGADDAELLSRPPVMLVHGDADPVVPAEAMTAARHYLEQTGFSVETHLQRGLGHGIDPEGIALGARFLARHLGVAG
ncbi:MAG TPA: alpha/beta fold hydrolase [Alphaproteobacteria bacterium]|jgi:phospholipase/carboxylesterase|nr:alpha/beta fold hydrolase [Alphaproteobacteria bacterium]